MYRKFLNARSPLRMLEKGLHGGLGPGNVGLVLAGPGVGKTSFLVGVALDELLRRGHVLHVALDRTVSHVRAHYDTVFEDLAATTHLEDEALLHAEVDRRRSIRVYPPNGFSPSKLREAVKLEGETAQKPSLVVVEGLDFTTLDEGDLADVKALAGELAAEVWMSVVCAKEVIGAVPSEVARFDSAVSVILALQPEDSAVKLRALKDHDNPDLADLHVALDPRTLLLVRD